jgi:ABC-type Mn2+/Zn2+ transport system ATPase subunit
MITLSNAVVEIDHLKILQGVSFQISPNSFYCLVGSNGSGKTTVLKLIMKISQVNSGNVDTVDPKDISYLPQNLPDPPFLSVGEVISVAIKENTKGRDCRQELLDALAEQFHLQGLLDRNFSDISTGEKQRVWLAFAIAQEKNMIIMDEPLSSVDRNSREEFYSLLKEVSLEGRTLLVVTHDIDMAMHYADKIISLQGGRVVFDGSPSEFVS